MSDKPFFPEILTTLPRPDIPVEGLDAYLIQGNSQQVIIMSFDKDTEVPGHSHEAQWGVVLDGRIELCINGNTQFFRKGDSYFIPEGTVHSAKIKKGYKDITIFNQKDRYRVK